MMPVDELDPELRLALEAILMVVEEPVPANALAQVLEAGEDQVLGTLRMLRREYLDHGHGFVLREVAGGWRLYTAPQAAAYVEKWVTHGRSAALSRAALETLAIIAYRQPVTRAAISEIRGVDADGAVRTLLARGLVEAVGRADTPGQPVLYATTTTFLEQLGIGSVDDLPALGVFAPPGPPPAEPGPGEHKAARRTLGRVPAGGLDGAGFDDTGQGRGAAGGDQRRAHGGAGNGNGYAGDGRDGGAGGNGDGRAGDGRAGDGRAGDDGGATVFDTGRGR